jgi:D-alanyl-D-alanine carboxypeptidase
VSRLRREVVHVAGPVATDLPPYVALVDPVTVERLGKSWRPDCPVGAGELRLVSLNHVGFDGRVHPGQLVVIAGLATEVAHIFADLYFGRFPIARMQTVEIHGADDERSMAANNTSAFNCRRVTRGTVWSNHAHGRAIDINPVQNPYIALDGSIHPPGGAPYVDRSRTDAGMIRPDGVVVGAFERRGWVWGGRWKEPSDYHHFDKP